MTLFMHGLSIIGLMYLSSMARPEETRPARGAAQVTSLQIAARSSASAMGSPAMRGAGAESTAGQATESTAGQATESAASAHPPTAVRHAGFALKVGGLVPTSRLHPAAWVGLDVEVPLSMVHPFLSIAAEATYAQPSLSGTLVNAAASAPISYALTQRMLSVGIEAAARFPVGPVEALAAAGYGFYFLDAITQAVGQIQSASQVRGGVKLRAGVGYAIMTRGEAFAELRWDQTTLQFPTTGLSNAGSVALGLGYRVWF